MCTMRRFLPLLATFYATVLQVAAATTERCHGGTNSVVPYAAEVFASNIEEDGTGFFRVMKRPDGRWWTIDPLGRGVVLLGVDHVKYQGFWSSRTKRRRYLETNRRKFPDKADWETNTLARLRSWGFNMLGGGCDPALERRNLVHSRSIRLSNALCLGKVPPDRYICPHEGSPCTLFPNVFHPDFEALCDDIARKECAPNRDDAWFVGYFIDNEIKWGEPALEGCFEPYLAKVRDALRKYDPNHLNLGCRFNNWKYELSNERMFRIAGRYMDIVSVNHYGHWQPSVETFRQWEKWSGKPVLVTEFYTKGEDTGLPNATGGGWRVHTQDERGIFYENFVNELLKSGVCVGWHWFKYMDNDPTDLTTDPSNRNSNKGIVAWDFARYDPLLRRMQAMNGHVYGLIHSRQDGSGN